MIRVGLIGCGFMGGMHAACYAALAELGVKVTAIADDRPEFLAQMKEQTDAQTYESGMALIEQADVDVVDICLPTYLHRRRTRARRWKRGAMCSAKSPSV
ncbi:MAG: Gfo/Idh/MocA family protein [Oscillospiraceae bacterium]